jgi:hypothetical protein
LDKFCLVREKDKIDKEKGTVSSHGDAEDLLITVASYDCMTLDLQEKMLKIPKSGNQKP